MTLTWPALEDALKRDDVDGVVALLRGASEKERKACAKPLLDIIAKGLVFNRRHPGFPLAVLGCAGGAQQAARGVRWMIGRDALGQAVDVLADRRPHWLPGFATALIAENRTSEWPLARALVRAGLCERPDHPNYIELMADSLGGPRLADALLDDPGLLDHEVWRLFEIEGVSSLLMYAEGWEGALAQLAADGHLNRQRLLDAALGAFLRDFKASQVGWYVRMHDALDPTLDEMAARQATYQRVLATDASVAIGLAQRCLAQLFKEKRLDVEAWLAEAEPPLYRKEKSVVVAQLRMLDAVAKAHPGDVARLALRALGHERSDVQERALKLLAKCGPDGLASVDPLEVADAAASVSPALRADAARVLGHVEQPPAPLAPSPSVPAVPSTWSPVEPVRNLDELADLLSRTLEQLDDPLDYERVLDGVAWAARTGTEPSLLSGAIGRARKLAGSGYNPFAAGSPWGAVAGVVLAWTDRTSFEPPHPDLRPSRGLLSRVLHQGTHTRPRWVEWFPVARAYELSVPLAAGRPTTVLSLPTDTSGAVGPAALGARVGEAVAGDLALLPIDTAQAVLRTDPARQHEALAAAPGKAAKALRAAFDEHRPPPTTTLTPMMGAPFAHWGDMRNVVLVEGAPATTPDLADPVSLLCALGTSFEDFSNRCAMIEYAASYGALAACMPLLAPHHPELVWAHAHFAMSYAVDAKAAVHPYLLRLLVDPQPLGPIATSLLTLALSATEADARALAAEVLATAAAQGRLDARRLGRGVGVLLGDPVKPNRVAPTLRDAARISTASAHAVLDALEETVPAAVDKRGIGDLLAVAADLVADLGRPWPNPDVLQPLLAKGGTSRAVKEARRLTAS